MRVDREVLDVLRHDPELLAIADAIAATQLRDVGMVATEYAALDEGDDGPRADIPAVP